MVRSKMREGWAVKDHVMFIVHAVGGATGASARGVAVMEVATCPDSKMMASEAEPCHAVVGDLAEVLWQIPLLMCR